MSVKESNNVTLPNSTDVILISSESEEDSSSTTVKISSQDCENLVENIQENINSVTNKDGSSQGVNCTINGKKEVTLNGQQTLNKAVDIDQLFEKV